MWIFLLILFPELIDVSLKELRIMSGLYIHVPFCKKRCLYCDFYSNTDMGYKKSYVESLLQEMELREELNGILAKHSGQSLETIKNDTERDNFMTAQMAKDYGLIDHILTRNELAKMTQK